MTASQAWRDGMQAVHDEAAGVLSVEVVQMPDLPRIRGAALAGNADAQRVLQVVRHALQGIVEAPRRKPMLCGHCPRPLAGGRFSIVAAFPSRDDASRGLALAICDGCGGTRDQVMEKAVLALRRIWPDGRQVAVTDPQGGRA